MVETIKRVLAMSRTRLSTLGIGAVLLAGVVSVGEAQGWTGAAAEYGEPVYVTRPDMPPVARDTAQRQYQANSNPWALPVYSQRRRPWGDVPRAGGPQGYLPGYSRGDSRSYQQAFDRAPNPYTSGPAPLGHTAPGAPPRSYAQPGPGYSRDRYAYDAYPYRGSYLEDALYPWWADYPGAGISAPYGYDVSSPYTAWPFGGYPEGPPGYGSGSGIW